MSAPPGSGRRVRVLLNPRAGSKAGLTTNDTPEAEVRSALARAGVEAELIATESEAEAARLTREAVARELLRTGTALGILPLGSVMNIARMLEIPRDLDEAAAIVATSPVRAIDVGRAKDMAFFEGGSVGLNAAVFREAQLVDAGRYTALFAAIGTLFRYRPSRMIIRLDHRLLTTRALAVTVANGPYTGLGFTVAPEARLDDGLFDVCVFSRFSRTELIRHFRSIAFGRRQYSPKVRSYRSARVEIRGVHPLSCRADAVDLGETPITYRVMPGVLRVISPTPAQAAPPAAYGDPAMAAARSRRRRAIAVVAAIAAAVLATSLTLRRRSHQDRRSLTLE